MTAGWVPGGVKASAGNHREGVPLSQEGGRVGGGSQHEETGGEEEEERLPLL